MSLNSVITNVSAQVALQSLNSTQSQLQATQKRISTGYRVADATDDGAAFAVAQRVRADTGALTTVNQQLGNASGLAQTALAGLTSVSNNVSSAKNLLAEIGNTSLSSDQTNQYITSFKALITQVANTVDGSTYNGQTLLGSTDGVTTAADKTVISSETGSTIKLNKEDASTLANALANLIGLTFSRASGVDTFAGTASGGNAAAASAAQTAALASIATGGGLSTIQTNVANSLNQAGADSNLLNATISFNSSKIDALNAGLGALVDADLSKESANLQALQIRQQLGTQALSLANQSPQSLLSLFK